MKVFIPLMLSLCSAVASAQSVDQRVIDALKRGFDFRTSIPVILRESEQGAVFLPGIGLQTYYEDSDWTDRFDLNVTTPEGWGVFTVRDIGDGWLEIQRQEHVITLHFMPGGERLLLRYSNYEEGGRPERLSFDDLAYSITENGFAITRLASDSLRARLSNIEYNLPPEMTSDDSGAWSQSFVSLIAVDSVGDLDLRFTAGSFVSVEEASHDQLNAEIIGDELRIVTEASAEVEIFDVLGKQLRSVSGGVATISRRTLPRGLLLLRSAGRAMKLWN